MNPLPPPPGGILARRKNRNAKGLALSADAAKPGTLSGASAADLLAHPAPPLAPRPSRPAPIQVAGSSRSNRLSLVSDSSSSRRGSADADAGGGPPTSASSASTAASTSGSRGGGSLGGYRDRLDEQLATLEVGVEFKLDLRNEDLQVLCELGSGNGGTVSKALHVPTKAIMAKKVR